MKLRCSPTYAGYLACLVAVILIGIGQARSLKDELATAQQLQRQLWAEKEAFRVLQEEVATSLAAMDAIERSYVGELRQIVGDLFQIRQQFAQDVHYLVTTLQASLTPEQQVRVVLEARLNEIDARLTVLGKAVRDP